MKTYNLGQLQRAYLVAELEQQEAIAAQPCLLCWKKSCGCNAPDVQTDAFLNFSDEVVEVKQLQFA